MTVTLAKFFLIGLGVYAFVGLVFGLIFLYKGVESIDEAARNTPTSFKALILPGVIALWPILLYKWLHMS